MLIRLIAISFLIASCSMTKPRTSWVIGEKDGKLKWGAFCEVTCDFMVKNYEVKEDSIYKIQGVTFHDELTSFMEVDDLLIIPCGEKGIPIYLYVLRRGKFKLIRQLSESRENGVCDFEISPHEKTYIIIGDPSDQSSGSFAIKTSYLLDLLDKKYSLEGLTMDCEKLYFTGYNTKSYGK